LPPKQYQELLFQIYFTQVNSLITAVDETIFREQAAQWWAFGNDIVLTKGPEGLPVDLVAFPALMFEIFALALIRNTTSYELQLDELKFAASQTFHALAHEYIECAEGLSKLFAPTKTALTGIQQSMLFSQWLIDTGDLMRAWDHSGETVR
jgi:hypothetical protein